MAFPGYGRWDCDILEQLRDRGATLREVADVVIARIADGKETPVIALEFCGALPAGNQAWQRSGRALSFSLAGVPYFYIAELGGHELDSDRNRRAPRLPNPAVPFSYVTNSAGSRAPSLPVFVMSPGATSESASEYLASMGEGELLAAIGAVLTAGDLTELDASLKVRALQFVRTRAASARRGSTLSPDQWANAFVASEQGTSLPKFLLGEKPIAWSKIAYIADLTDSARELMQVASQLARGMTSAELPICLVDAADRTPLALELQRIYGELPVDFLEWLSRSQPLTICWVMGFKPKGDDARPDRGLPPLARMLIGPDQDLLTIVYGPAPKSTWPLLASKPFELAAKNGLWEAVFASSDALLVDSATLGAKSQRAYRKEHFRVGAHTGKQKGCVATPIPNRFGEQDVDTALHLLLCRLAAPAVYEGMCNPPGGDWSGLSVLSPDGEQEHRWLTLPRVGLNTAKRPDHVFQIFGVYDKPVLLIVESKELASDVEANVGGRLGDYVRDLLKSIPSITRPFGEKAAWTHGTSAVAIGDFERCTAVAFLSNSQTEMSVALVKSSADLAIGFAFNANGHGGSLFLRSKTKAAASVVAFIMTLDLTPLGLVASAVYE